MSHISNLEIQFGCYFAVFNNKKATTFVLEEFRKNFPKNPILLISDGGEDFSDLAHKYSCEYVYLENIFGDGSSERPHLPYDAERTKKWWERQKMVCDRFGLPYNLILEDDVWVRSSFKIQNDFDLRGSRVGNWFQPAIRGEILDKTGKDVPKYNMSGGSMYSTSAFLNIYDDVIEDIERNHDDLLTKGYNPQLGAVDANITYHFVKRGYTVEVNPYLTDVCEHKDHSKYSIIHQWKNNY